MTEAILQGTFEPSNHLNADTLSRQLGGTHNTMISDVMPSVTETPPQPR